MRTEHKELLLKDLCSRLYYKVKVSLIYNNEEYKGTLCAIYPEDNRVIIDNLNKPCHYYKQTCGGFLIGENKVKPYLFPLSSMTEEQYNSLHELGILDNCSHSYEYVNPHIHGVSFIFKEFKTYSLELIEWLNKHHFDYHGLIEKGLAIDATNLNIY